MHAMADDFRSRYDSLSDEALLAENREELVDLARECLDGEMARRGLAPPATEPEPKPAENLAPGDELVPVADFLSREEGDLARGLLESAGIPCGHASGQTTGTDWSMTGSLRLLVPARFLDQARELLESPVSEEELAAEAEAAAEAAEDGHKEA